MPESRRRIWTLVLVSLGLFMVVLDNLVVSVALPSIHASLGASVQALEWTVNAYTLSYAVLLLTGSALRDRCGRRRMFMAGISLFTIPPRPRRSHPQPACGSRPVPLRESAPRPPPRSRSSPMPSRRPSAGSPSACGQASAGSRWRSARSSAAPSSPPDPGTTSSGSTFPSGASTEAVPVLARPSVA